MVPVEIRHQGVTTRTTVNHGSNPSIDDQFGSVGQYQFGQTGNVTISNAGTGGHVIIDAVRWVQVE